MTLDEIVKRPEFLTLSPQRQTFTREYLTNGFDAVAAATAAYPRTLNPKSVTAMSYELLGHAAVKKILDLFFGRDPEQELSQEVRMRILKSINTAVRRGGKTTSDLLAKMQFYSKLQETQMNTGMSLDEVAKTAAFQTLGRNLQGALLLALPQRDLSAALKTLYPNWDEPTLRRAVSELLQDENVRKVIEAYTFGVAEPAVNPVAETPAGPTQALAEIPEVVPAEPAATAPQEPVPTIDCGTFETEATL